MEVLFTANLFIEVLSQDDGTKILKLIFIPKLLKFPNVTGCTVKNPFILYASKGHYIINGCSLCIWIENNSNEPTSLKISFKIVWHKRKYWPKLPRKNCMWSQAVEHHLPEVAGMSLIVAPVNFKNYIWLKML